MKTNPILACQKQHPTRTALFIRKLDLYLRNIQKKCRIWAIAVYGAELEHFGKKIRNTWKVSICGAGEVWRSVGAIV
jgi:hypothetical protein